jgi:hypothetical protein
MGCAKPKWSTETWHAVLAFWCLGLLNNANYVIMNSGAKVRGT